MIGKKLHNILFGTLRRQLIVGVAVVHAVMMTLFICDLTWRQQALILDRQKEHATALAHTLATSSAGWLAADDVSGLQELVEGQRRYPDLKYAMLLNNQGQVLAHTDRSRIGFYVLDLPGDVRETVLSRNMTLVDVIVPAMLSERHVGWARVGIGQRLARQKLAEVTRYGVLYGICAVLTGSLLALLMGKRITRRLYEIQSVMDEVRSGNHKARSNLTGTDEAAGMAKNFNTMLDMLGQREQEARQSEYNYRLLIENVPAAVVVHGPHTEVIVSNTFAQTLLGLTEDQMRGKEAIDPAWSFIREDGTVMPVEEFPVSRVVAENHPLRDFIVGINRPDVGFVVWAFVNADPVFNEEGKLSQVLVSFVDITERKRAEEALKEQYLTLRSIIDSANALIFSVDQHYRYTSFNKGHAAVIKTIYGTEIHLGHSLLEYMTVAEDRETARHNIDRALAGEQLMEEAFSGEELKSRKYFQVSHSPVRTETGEVIGVAVLAQDMTEHKRAEEEIRTLNQELDQRVRERTVQLEAANKELEAFSYSVSHDLRAPLRHIDGFIELLKNRNEEALDEKSLHFMAIISDSVKQMSMLIDDLLSFSRMGRQEMSRMPVDLDSLLHEVLKNMEFENQGRNIHWSIGHLPAVTGDCSMLRIVLVNLISNALKFTKQREQAEIEIGCLPDREKEVVIFVRDNGVGFDMKYADKLFGVFQRLHRAEEFEGTGIGLANIRRIINRHGGTTWAEGRVDYGATVYFSLPLT